MGNMAYRALALSQQDVEELRMEHCRGRLSQTEVEALFARFRSRVDHTFGEKVLSAMRAGFGGHVEPKKQG